MGQLAKRKFTFGIVTPVNMGQNITIHPRISSRAPSVRALESKQSKISDDIKFFHRYPIYKSMFPPGLEPGTFRVLGERDNHYTTETCLHTFII